MRTGHHQGRSGSACAAARLRQDVLDSGLPSDRCHPVVGVRRKAGCGHRRGGKTCSGRRLLSFVALARTNAREPENPAQSGGLWPCDTGRRLRCSSPSLGILLIFSPWPCSGHRPNCRHDGLRWTLFSSNRAFFTFPCSRISEQSSLPYETKTFWN